MSFEVAKKEPTQRDSNLENESSHVSCRIPESYNSAARPERLAHVSFMACIKIDAEPSARRLPGFSPNRAAAVHFEELSPTV